MSEAATAPVEPTNGDADKKKGGKREERKRDETPIEELYDLSQTIPKVRLSTCAEVEYYDLLTKYMLSNIIGRQAQQG